MRISKFTGMIICFLIMCPYVLGYWVWVYKFTYSTELTIFFFFGVLLHYLQKIEADTEEEVLFNEKSLRPVKIIWDDGFCLLPVFLPTLRNFKIHLGYRLKKYQHQDVSKVSTRVVNIEHYRNQRLPNYEVKAETGLIGLSIHNFIGRKIHWFFNPSEGSEELYYQRVGFRFVLVSLFLGFMVTSPLPAVTQYFPSINNIFPPKGYIPLWESQVGACKDMNEVGQKIKIHAHTLPVEMIHIAEPVILEMDGKLYKSTWTDVYSGNVVFPDGKRIIYAISNSDNSRICF